jgi:hydroxymethylpyrimidine/phosphomethylpyrimidine kinase
MTTAPDVLLCAGLDPSGGAGLLADVRVVTALGGRPVGVVTALTVQNTTATVSAEPVSADLVREQLEFLLSDVEVRAVKIGMLGSTAIADAIGRALALTGAPVVWDPVLAPSLGDARLLDGPLAAALAALLPHVAVLTPNASELAVFTGQPITSLADAIAAGTSLASRLASPVLVKGGHLSHDDAVDILCRPDGHTLLAGPRLPGAERIHGTGCALSSALATHLALGAPLLDACRAAKDFVAARLAAPVRPGRGAPAVI